MSTKKKITKKVAKKKLSSGKKKVAHFSVLKAKISALEKEITRNVNNEAMEDAMEDKVDILEEEVKEVFKEGKISKIEDNLLRKDMDRLKDMVD